jgi:hypothetical protein
MAESSVGYEAVKSIYEPRKATSTGGMAMSKRKHGPVRIQQP